MIEAMNHMTAFTITTITTVRWLLSLDGSLVARKPWQKASGNGVRLPLGHCPCEGKKATYGWIQRTRTDTKVCQSRHTGSRCKAHGRDRAPIYEGTRHSALNGLGGTPSNITLVVQHDLWVLIKKRFQVGGHMRDGLQQINCCRHTLGH